MCFHHHACGKSGFFRIWWVSSTHSDPFSRLTQYASGALCRLVLDQSIEVLSAERSCTFHASCCADICQRPREKSHDVQCAFTQKWHWVMGSDYLVRYRSALWDQCPDFVSRWLKKFVVSWVCHLAKVHTCCTRKRAAEGHASTQVPGCVTSEDIQLVTTCNSYLCRRARENCCLARTLVSRSDAKQKCSRRE